MAGTLIDSLVPVVDRLRGSLHTSFGVRPYRVYIVRTQWAVAYPVPVGQSVVASSCRGDGVEIVKTETEIVPTPRLGELTGIAAILSAMGRNEDGEVQLTEISLTYAETDLAPRSVAANEQFFFEIREGSGQRRRFFPTSAPFRDVERGIGWTVRLRKQNDDRGLAGGVA